MSVSQSVREKESNPLPSRSLKQLINVLSLLIGTEIKKAHINKTEVSRDPIATFDVGLFHVRQI